MKAVLLPLCAALTVACSADREVEGDLPALAELRSDETSHGTGASGDAGATVVKKDGVAEDGLTQSSAQARPDARLVYRRSIDQARKTLDAQNARAKLEKIDAFIEREKDLMQ